MTTYANWVAKASGLLTEVADLERGMSLRIDLPPHWLSPVFLGAAWTVGLKVTESDEPGRRGVRPRRAWTPGRPAPATCRCSRAACARWACVSPSRSRPACSTSGVEIWSQPDGFTAWDPPTGRRPRHRHLTQARAAGATT